MRIGLDARYLYTYFTGVGRYSYNLIRALAELDNGHDYVVFKHRSYTAPIVEQPRFKELTVPMRAVGPGTLTTFAFTAAREHVNLLHSHFPVAPLVRSFRSIVTVHDLQPILVPQFSGLRPLPLKLAYDVFYRFAYRATIPRASRLICGSQATADDVTALYNVPSGRIRIIPYGIDARFQPVTDPTRLAAFRNKHSLPEEFMLYVGNTRPHKNVPGLLRGFARFLDLSGDSQATIVLAGAKERFFADVVTVVRALELERQVIYLDHLPDDELPLFYSAARLLALLSTKEGFGLPPIEAMACGTPVVVSTYGALPEVVGDAGLQVDPFDCDAIGRAMLRLWSDEDLRRILQERGLARAARFTWEETARRTLEVYREVCD